MCTYTHIYIYTYRFWTHWEIDGNLGKKKTFLPTLAWPDISNFGKHGFFPCDVLKKLLSKKFPNCAFQLPTKWVLRVSKVGWFFFEAQQKGGFWNCCSGQMIREKHLSKATFRSLPKKQRCRWSLRLLNCLDLGNESSSSLIDFQGQGGC